MEKGTLNRMHRLTILFLFTFLLACQSERVSSVDSTLVDSRVSENQQDTLLNDVDYLVLGKPGTQVKVVAETEVENYPNYEVLIGYRGDVLIGENIHYRDVEIYRKYTPQTTFEDFPAEVYIGALAEPDFMVNHEAKQFITQIKEECDNGINFAGHYTLVAWGCDSPCQSGVIVDRITGEIHMGYGSSLGSDFRKDSKMLIRNSGAVDTTNQRIGLCAYCEVSHEVWNGSQFEVVE